MPIEVTIVDTLIGLDDLAIRCEIAGQRVTKDALVAIRKYAIALAPAGTPGNTTNPPGTLKRHITIDGPTAGKVRWTGKVGPTVVSANRWAHNYGGQREFGGGIFAHNPTGRLFFQRFGQWYSPASVTQKGSHYLLRARIFSMPSINRALYTRFSLAVAG
jgi:hypothetical protein